MRKEKVTEARMHKVQRSLTSPQSITLQRKEGQVPPTFLPIRHTAFVSRPRGYCRELEKTVSSETDEIWPGTDGHQAQLGEEEEEEARVPPLTSREAL